MGLGGFSVRGFYWVCGGVVGLGLVRWFGVGVVAGGWLGGWGCVWCVGCVLVGRCCAGSGSSYGWS